MHSPEHPCQGGWLACTGNRHRAGARQMDPTSWVSGSLESVPTAPGPLPTPAPAPAHRLVAGVLTFPPHKGVSSNGLDQLQSQLPRDIETALLMNGKLSMLSTPTRCPPFLWGHSGDGVLGSANAEETKGRGFSRRECTWGQVVVWSLQGAQGFPSSLAWQERELPCPQMGAAAEFLTFRHIP